ncbi:GrpB family protein [Sorangium cellulosum]|uniref:GrpB family protein n=1 Tax=Sorangium cellulosum TaxID=56 RepID=UPI003D9A513B
MAEDDRKAPEALGYEHLGEAGVVGPEYVRRRGTHDTNLAVVEWGASRWHDNLLLRGFLRAHEAVAAEVARSKQEAWQSGARTLLAYSERKRHAVSALLDRAKGWRAAHPGEKGGPM